MEIKRLKFLGFERGSFLEKRLIYLDPPPEAESPDEAAEHQKTIDRAVQFIAKLNTDGVAIEGGDKPESILEDNPYADHIISFAQNFDDPANPDEILTFEVTEDTDGKITLTYGTEEFIIEKELYVAIFWKKIKPQLDKHFAGKNISDELIEEAAVSSTGFQNFLFYLATNPEPVDPKKVQEVLRDLDALKPTLAPAAVKAREAVGKGVEAAKTGAEKREEFREHEGLPTPKVRLPVAPKLNKDQFIAKYNDPNLVAEFDRWQVNIDRQKTKINASDWGTNHIKIDGLEKIYQDFRDLGIIKQNPEFYDTMFAILRNGADPSNPYLAEDRYRVMFENPSQNRDALKSLDPKGSFWGGEQYVLAYDQLQKIQTIVMSQDAKQTGLADAQRKLKEDPVADTAVNFVKSNLVAFQTAIKEKDWATAGVYAVGIYAVYQAYKRLAGGNDNVKKWLIYGAAAYAGNVFLKNAGYDILKMVGIKDADYEVKGTPMEVMKNILSTNPSLWEQTKDIDYGIVVRMSDVNLKDLHKLYLQSNKEGIQFIHPKDIKNIFKDEAQVWPFKTGKGVKIQDYLGMNGQKLNYKQKEYVRVGQQIYKIAFAMQGIYNETLRKGAPDATSEEKRHSPYEGKTYEEALNDQTLKLSHMWHMMDAAAPYANLDVDSDIIGIRKKQEVEDMINGAFADMPQEGAYIDNELSEGSGHFAGKIRNFPVVFVRSREGWKVYLKHRYGKGYVKEPGLDYMTIIPFTGPDRSFRARQAIDGVKRRMMDLIQPLTSVGGRDLLSRTLVYDAGKWKCKVEFGAADEYDIAASEQEAIIEPNGDGDAVTLMDTATMGEAFRIHVSEEVAKQNPVNTILIPRLVDQKEFAAFRILSFSDSLRVKDDTPGDFKFTLDIGGKLQATIKYDKATKKFVFDPASQETEMLKAGSGFAEVLGESLQKDEKLNKVFDSWKKLIDETPENYFVNFFKHVPDWFKGFTLDSPARGIRMEHFTGSVPKNYTLALLESQKQFVISKVVNSSYDAKNLAEIGDKIDQVYTPAVNDLDRQRMNFAALNTKNYEDGKKFSADAFKDTVFRGISEVGIKSADYKDWHRKFVDSVFLAQGFDDLRDARAIKARDLVKVFAYYASAVDDPAMDGANKELTLSAVDAEKVEKVRKAKDDLEKAGQKVEDKDLATLSGIPMAEIPATLKLLIQVEKKEKYLIHSEYVNYVVGQINLRVREGEVGKRATLPSAESSFWDIEKFYVWKQRPRTANYEFVDRERTLRMARDYVTFDEYVKLPAAERTKWTDDQVILPRKTVEVTLSKDDTLRKKELEIFRKITGVKSELKPEEVPLTEFEAEFRQRLFDLVDYFKKEYTGRVKEDAFQLFLEYYRPAYQIASVKKDAATKTYSYKFEVGTQASTGPFTAQKPELFLEVPNLETNLTSVARTMTRTEQRDAINRRVEAIVADQIMNDSNFGTYFDRTGLLRSMKDMWVDFKDWLWGLRH